MSNLPKTIKISELPEAFSISDDDMFIIEDGSVTHKISGQNLVTYMTDHESIKEHYIPTYFIDSANGVAPLR